MGKRGQAQAHKTFRERERERERERFIHSSCNIDNKKIKFSQHVKMLLLTEYKLRLSALYYRLVQKMDINNAEVLLEVTCNPAF